MTRKSYQALVCLLAGLALLPVAGVQAGSDGRDWPQFRGANRDGMSPETGLLAEWPEAGPTEVWRRPLGEGYSAISVVGDRLYTMYAGDLEGKQVEFAAAFDADTGKELWRTPMGEKLETQFGHGPRSTPTVDGDTVYVLDARGNFAALSAKDGSKRWTKSLTEDFGAKQPHWGYATSALVDGKHVILEAGGPEGKAYVGLDKKTGEVAWSLGDTPAGYNSVLPVKMNGKDRYIYVVDKKLMAIDPEGEQVWSFDWPAGETHAMPVFISPNRIFASGAEGVGGSVVEVKEEGGKEEVAEVWRSRFMRNHFSSSVLHDGHLFGFDNATLKCIAAKDAEMAWAKRGLGKGSLIYADGHLIVLSDSGKLLLLEATPEGYVEKGNVQALKGRCWTAPSLANGRLYLRNDVEMVVYRIGS